MLLGAAPGAQATIVYRNGSDIWAMNDNGSGAHVLVSGAQTPGMDQGLDHPAVDPNGGTVVAFEGTTQAFTDSFHDTCYGSYVYACPITHYGLNATGIYTWSAGSVTRLSGAPGPCAAHDGCTTLDINPVPIAGGSIYFDLNTYSGRLSQGDFVAGSRIYRMNRDGSGRADYGTACDDATFLDTIAPNWANPAQIAYNGCQDSSSDDGELMLGSGGPGGSGATLIAHTALPGAWFEAFSFAPNGSSIVAYDNSFSSRANHAGLYLLRPSASGAPVRELLAAPTDTSDPSFPSALRFSSPHFVGANTIVFGAEGDIWSIPASCNACAFPAGATALTRDGQDADPAWTSAPLSNPGSGPGPAPGPRPGPGSHTGPGKVSVGTGRIGAMSVSIPIRCTGHAGATCTVSLVLGAMETLKNGRVIAVSAAAPRHKTVVLGAISISLAAGRRATLTVGLNRSAKQLLSHFHVLHALLVVANNGRALASGRLVFTVARRRHQTRSASDSASVSWASTRANPESQKPGSARSMPTIAASFSGLREPPALNSSR
jgi:hypothetical protein